MQYRHRYYSWKLGCFISRDPKGYVDGWNLYEYAGGRVVTLSDPMGSEIWTVKRTCEYTVPVLKRHVPPRGGYTHGGIVTTVEGEETKATLNVFYQIVRAPEKGICNIHVDWVERKGEVPDGGVSFLVGVSTEKTWSQDEDAESLYHRGDVLRFHQEWVFYQLTDVTWGFGVGQFSGFGDIGRWDTTELQRCEFDVTVDCCPGD